MRRWSVSRSAATERRTCREATKRYYRADREAAGSLAIVLEEMWSRDLGRLKQAVEEPS
jgi:hypothetical protein